MKKSFVFTVLSLASAMVAAGQSKDLAAAAQNPLASMISLPFQNNTTFGNRDGDVSNTLNIQPVLPFELGDDWNLITRTIIPVVSAPDPFGGGNVNGISDTSFTGWFSPKEPVNHITWGVGPTVNIPTGNKDFGFDQWGAGISAVGVYIKDKWVAGGLASNTWGFEDTGDLNLFYSQVFVNYNMENGWYVVSAPIFTADWNADSSDRWVVPIGGGIGKIMRWGKQPVNLNAQIYYNIEKPEDYGDYTFRLQLQFMFPKS
ncbi:hypothetical protein [Persicirhabdus sediminis]|uniref:Neuromedin U n=1 Tax=Persicirhabdus sediminis TaxID=454144 RepID=A0A8J7MCC3_9BACT|nr:hypothetical protein [Persicirhabdus sediminis]MBK1790787.1 hypothetical protein [Persicirhabdus sediminis]